MSTLPTTTDTPSDTPSDTHAEDPGQALCPVCPHPLSAHDRISARYCAASADQVARGVLTNPGCSCPAGQQNA